MNNAIIIGIIDFKRDIGKCNIYIENDGKYTVPHFHILALNNSFHTNICLDHEAYYLHSPSEKIDRFLDYDNDIELYNILNLWMNYYISDKQMTNHDYLKEVWKINNPKCEYANNLAYTINYYTDIIFDIILVKNKYLTIVDTTFSPYETIHVGNVELPNIGKCFVTINNFENDYNMTELYAINDIYI